MVYLDVYDAIFRWLEKKGLVDDVFSYSEEMLKPLLPKDYDNQFYNELMLEFALFSYVHENKLLLDFLDENLRSALSKNERKEFELIKASERLNLRFEKKIKTGQLDTRGRELYDFYFTDLKSSETKVIASSSPLDSIQKIINARLIRNPLHNKKYSIIGAIMDEKTFEHLSEASALKFTLERLKDSKKMAEHILKFSKEHNLDEIDRYENKSSTFVNQDKKIMRINRLFFEKFGMGIDDFMKGFFALSNSQGRFMEMAEHYLSIEDELKNAIMDTNYLFELLLKHTEIKGFAAFLKNDFRQLEECVIMLQSDAEKEFENLRKNQIALTREKIIEHQTRFLKEKIAPQRLEGFDSFMKRVDACSPDSIEKFLEDVAGYLGKHYKNPDFDLAFAISVIEDWSKNAEEIPYLKEVQEAQKNWAYNPERFYEYAYYSDEGRALCIFLFAAHLVQKNEPGKAYQLLRSNKPKRTDSFAQMFFVGKVFSLFNDDDYKTYSRKAKEIDKARYKAELKEFLTEKTRKNA